MIQLESGKHVVADVILFSVGRIGATDALNLEAPASRPTIAGGSRSTRSSGPRSPHIYAAGDVIGYPALAATSSEQGRLAACHMFGLTAEPMGAHFPIGIYAIPEISMVGATEEELTRAKVPYETGIARFREIARGQIMGDDSGLFKMIFHREDGRLLGAHCIGTRSHGARPHRAGRARPGRRPRLLPEDGLQLPDPGRVLQGRGVQRRQQAAVRPGPHRRVPGLIPAGPLPFRRGSAPWRRRSSGGTARPWRDRRRW